MFAQDDARRVPAHSPTSAVGGMGCTPCEELLGECGLDLFKSYSKLLIRGWPGRVSPVERGYVRAHRSRAASRQARHRAANLRKVRFQAQKSNTRGGETVEVDSDTTRVSDDANGGAS